MKIVHAGYTCDRDSDMETGKSFLVDPVNILAIHATAEQRHAQYGDKPISCYATVTIGYRAFTFGYRKSKDSYESWPLSEHTFETRANAEQWGKKELRRMAG